MEYGYNEPIMARRIKRVKAGNRIKAYGESGEKIANGRPAKSVKEYKVVAVYPWHIRCVSGNEVRCFTLGDLVKLGIEPRDLYAVEGF